MVFQRIPVKYNPSILAATLVLMLICSAKVFSQDRIRYTTIREIGVYNKVEVSESSPSQVSIQGLEVTAQHLNPVKTNDLVTRILSRNGLTEFYAYEKSKREFFIRKRSRNGSKLSDQDYLLAGLNELYDTLQIDREGYDRLRAMILGSDELNEGQTYADFPLEASPFRLGVRSTNNFLIKLRNSSDKAITIRLEPILQLGNEIHRPFSQNELFSFNGGTPENQVVLNSVYWQTETKVPAGAEIQVVVAFPMIDPFQPEIMLYLADRKFVFNVNCAVNKIDVTEDFYEFSLYPRFQGGPISESNAYYLIPKEYSNHVFITNRSIFIAKGKIEDSVRIFAYYLDQDALFYGNLDIKGSTLLNFDKKHRKDAEFKLFRLNTKRTPQ